MITYYLVANDLISDNVEPGIVWMAWGIEVLIETALIGLIIAYIRWKFF